MTPFLQDTDMTVYVGDALEVLRGLPAGSVGCCVSSPPYWALRDYGVDGQIGLEQTPDEYVATMVNVFREVRRVLADHGTCWVNLGSSFHEKQEQMIPARVALALQADGWWLRSEIVWSKLNPMPESVTDRPTKSHEMIYLLTKQPRYFFDQEAVREAHVREWGANNGGTFGGTNWMKDAQRIQGGRGNTHNDPVLPNPAGRNIRSVWSIATQPYPEAHFATFPEELPRRAIAAGCPLWVCGTCGEPRTRIVEAQRIETRPGTKSKYGGADEDIRCSGEGNVKFGLAVRTEATFSTLGWSDCGHGNYRPGVVLDPFAGAGTTLLVARKLGRHSVGIELNPEYAELIKRRTQQLSLLGDAA